MTQRPVITIKQVAEKCGLSVAAVSYALRGKTKISEETRKRVAEVAQSLGYRPNPRVAGLMAHIRRARGPSLGERIAFVWVHTAKAESRSDPFLRTVFDGARLRAEQLGYTLEEFWTDERGMKDRRLSDILKARAIGGVLFSPVMHEVTVRLDFEWQAFCCAVIGQAEWVPELHHSGHHHYHAMRVTLDELGRRGCRRPALVLDAQTNERGRRAWQAAFLVYHPQPRDAAGLILHGLPGSAAELQAWLARKRPDAVILHFNELVRRYQAWAPAAPGRVVCALRWSPDLADLPGIDQRFDLVAANAVDLVVSQLITNERGVPPVHRVTLFPGQWMDGPGAPVAAPA
jgi:LacI family transcriptional regulator